MLLFSLPLSLLSCVVLPCGDCSSWCVLTVVPLCGFSPSTEISTIPVEGEKRYWLLCVLLLYCEMIDIDMKLGDGMFSRKNKKKTYDVQVKAWKPKRVVTIARVSTYERAAEIRDGLTAIGFEVMISWKRDENDVI